MGVTVGHTAAFDAHGFGHAGGQSPIFHAGRHRRHRTDGGNSNSADSARDLAEYSGTSCVGCRRISHRLGGITAWLASGHPGCGAVVCHRPHPFRSRLCARRRGTSVGVRTDGVSDIRLVGDCCDDTSSASGRLVGWINSSTRIYFAAQVISRALLFCYSRCRLAYKDHDG